LLVLLVALVIYGVARTGPAYGHHSFAAYYLESESMTIEGDVVEFQYKAPHAWVQLDVMNAAGRVQRFAAEWSNPSRLERDGIARDTLQPGDRVSITGAPSRDPESGKIHLKKITRFSRGEWAWQGRTGRR
jgi:hypothetical protein